EPVTTSDPEVEHDGRRREPVRAPPQGELPGLGAGAEHALARCGQDALEPQRPLPDICHVTAPLTSLPRYRMTEPPSTARACPTTRPLRRSRPDGPAARAEPRGSSCARLVGRRL